MKINKKDIPIAMEGPGTKMRTLPGFGGMDVNFHELPQGTDFTPLLKGLDNDSCHCPHYGYIFEGKMRVIYDDKTEELLEPGDIFYLPAGHTAIVEENMKMIDFSPSKAHMEVLTHVGEMMAKMG